MNRHTATDPAGKVHSRNSQNRLYTHAVFYKADPALWEANFVMGPERIEQDRRNYAYFAKHPEHVDMTSIGYKNEADYVADKINLRRSSKSGWFCAGWCGRLNLAQKLAAQWSGGRYGYTSVIVAAEVK